MECIIFVHTKGQKTSEVFVWVALFQFMTLHIVNHLESEYGIETLDERTPFHSKDEAIEYYNNLWAMYHNEPTFTEKIGDLHFSVDREEFFVSVWVSTLDI